MVMKKISLLLSICFLFLLQACNKNFIEATSAKPAKDIKNARKMLTDKKKWIIDEAYENNALVYAQGKNLNENTEIDVEYCSFYNDGTFAVKYLKEDLDTSMKYNIDQTANEIVFYDENGYFDNFKINAGSVYEKNFTMTASYNENGFIYTMKIKLKALE